MVVEMVVFVRVTEVFLFLTAQRAAELQICLWVSVELVYVHACRLGTLVQC
jgi:hypothetical protein